MARLIGGPFGSVSGRVGDVIYRNRGGKTIVSALPTQRTSPRSERELELQAKFAYVGKIARAINSIEILKHFWKPNASNGKSGANIIFKNNYALIDVKDLSGAILVAPLFGFNLSEPSIEAGKTSLLIKCQSMTGNPEFDTKVEKYISAAGVIVLKNPSDERLPIHDVIAFKTLRQFLYPNKELIIDLEFAGGTLQLFQSYAIKKISAVFVTMDEDENPIQHSVTFSNKD